MHTAPTSRPRLEYAATPSDVDAFAAHDLASAPHLTGRIRRMRVVWAVVFAVIAIEYGRVSPLGALGFVAVAIAYLAAYGPLNRYLYRRQVRGLPDASAGAVTLTVVSGRVALEDAGGKPLLPPSAVRRIDESADHYFLYVGPSTAIVVPRSRIIAGDVERLVESVRAAGPGR